MAKKTANPCDPITETIAELALSIAAEKGVGLDGVVAEMSAEFEGITRKMVADAIVDYRRSKAVEVSEMAKNRAAVAREAITDNALRSQLEGALKRLEKADLSRLTPKQRKAATLAIQALRTELKGVEGKIDLMRKKQEAESRLTTGTPKPKGEPRTKATVPTELEAEVKELDSLEKLTQRGRDLQAKIDALRAGTYELPQATQKMLSAREQAEAFKNYKLKVEADRLVAQAKPKGLIGKIYDEVNHTLGGMLTFLDDSFVLSQGAMHAYAHPVKATEATAKSLKVLFALPGMEQVKAAYRSGGLKSMWKALGENSDKVAHAIDAEIEARPNYPLMLKSKLLAHGHEQSELFLSNVLGAIPGYTRSGNAFSAASRLFRADAFDGIVENLGGEVTAAEADAIARSVKVLTGGGGDPSQLSTWAGRFLWAPRKLSSVIQTAMMGPVLGPRAGPYRVRKEFAKWYGKSLLGWGVLMSLGLLAGWEVERDPRSTDFMRLRKGDTRIDLTAGLSTFATALARFRTGETKTDAGVSKTDRGRTAWKFFQYKAAPLLSLMMELNAGENAIGQPRTPLESMRERVVPLGIREIVENWKAEGVPEKAILPLLTFFGVRSSTYERGGRRPSPASPGAPKTPPSPK